LSGSVNRTAGRGFASSGGSSAGARPSQGGERDDAQLRRALEARDLFARAASA
jgi:hypothetical protein